MKCKKCGSEIPDNSKFCTFCGNELKIQKFKEAISSHKLLMFFMILTITLIIFTIAKMVIIHNANNNNNYYPYIELTNKSEEKINTINANSKARPYAVMIDNNHSAWPQCGLSEAYLVYEIITEGGLTQMMALYKDVYPEKVGSVRSARHYFIDYAEENDAIFIHWGGSPQAYSRINSGIDDLDGIALEGSMFFRDKTLNRDYEHTGFVDLAKAKEYSDNKGYTRDTNKDLLLNYSATEIDLSTNSQAKIANSITLEYSNNHTTSYEYDKENKVYKRTMSGISNVDLETGKQYTVKNIIVYNVRNYTFDTAESKGIQELDNIGNGTGYYITNGYAVPITWEKTSHSSQTLYKYEDGTKISVNNGNTFIQICPTDTEIEIR